MDKAVKMTPLKRRLLWLFFYAMTVIDELIHWLTDAFNWGFGDKEYDFCYWSHNNFAELEYQPNIHICPACEDRTEIETWSDKYGIFFRCRVCGEEFEITTARHVSAIDKIRQEKE